MKKELILSLLLCSSSPFIFSQQQEQIHSQEQQNFQPRGQVSTFQQVDKIRKALNLNQKEFEKVYKAYETYNKAIYGDSNQASFGGGPRGGMGGPHGGMGGPGGGMGGPGGGMGGPGNMSGERPNMSQDSNSRPTPPKEMSEKDLEKMHKKMQKQEDKLSKSIRKVIKDDSKFAQWQQLRQEEIMPPKQN
jgi:hypothetical protein